MTCPASHHAWAPTAKQHAQNSLLVPLCWHASRPVLLSGQLRLKLQARFGSFATCHLDTLPNAGCGRLAPH